MAAAGMGIPKNSRQLYRDCLRLIKHMAGTTSPKAVQLRAIVAARFRANAHVTDAAALHALRSSAERGLSNYLLFERAKQDPKIAASAARLDTFEDDEHGNLVRVVSPTPAGAASAAAAAAAGAAAGIGARSGRGGAGPRSGKVQ